MPRPGYRHGTPKAGALPTALHPVIQFIYPAGRILPNVAPYQLGYTRIFNFCHYTTTGEKVKGFPAGRESQRGSGYREKKGFPATERIKDFPAAEEIERFQAEEKTKGFSGGWDALRLSKYTALGLNFLL